MPSIRLLLIEDSEADARLLLEEVRRAGFHLQSQRVETESEMRRALQEPWDAIVSDHRLPRFSGSEALRLYRESGLDIPFLIVSGTIGEVAAVECMRGGAHDYVMKGNLTRLVPALRRELQEAHNRQRQRAAEVALLQAETEKKEFCRQVLRALSGGKFQLIDAEELSQEGRIVLSEPLVDGAGLARVRRSLRELGREVGLLPESVDDLVLAVGEAASNAVKHGKDAFCEVRLREDRISVRVGDRGPGIRPQDLPAVLEAGYSSKISLGMGYTIMLKLADVIQLATSSEGTVVNVEMFILPRSESAETRALAMLERF